MMIKKEKDDNLNYTEEALISIANSLEIISKNGLKLKFEDKLWIIR